MNEFVPYDAIDIANYFIYKAKKSGNDINNLKLQKILYYAYAFFKENNLFEEVVEKWRLGPVVPEVYHSFKHYGANPIVKTVDKLDMDRFEIVNFDEVLDDLNTDQNLINYLDKIFELLININPFKIVQKTHEEPMWSEQETDIELGVQHLEYSNDEIRHYFDTKNMNDYLGF